MYKAQGPLNRQMQPILNPLAFEQISCKLVAMAFAGVSHRNT